ncbi:MAG: hypothetical protein IIW70_07975 [Bacteroidales bacterium]|nr:hypothetical protein [Bacteroidales bacterium]
MRKLLLLFVLFFVSGIMSAQELVPFSMSHDIKSVVYHTVDAKGNLLSVSKDSIALDSGDFFNGQATIYSFVTEGDKTTKVKLPISFEEGEVIVDLGKIIQESMNQMLSEEEDGEEMKEMLGEIEVTGEAKGIPADIKVGDKLPDYELVIDMGIVATKIKAYDRKVVAQETVTTEAGTFDCFVIEITQSVRAFLSNEKSYSRGWYSRGFGVIKEEVLDKKGRVLQTKTLVEVVPGT